MTQILFDTQTVESTGPVQVIANRDMDLFGRRSTIVTVTQNGLTFDHYFDGKLVASDGRSFDDWMMKGIHDNEEANS